MIRPLLRPWAVLACAVLAGCATMTFKRGAGPGAAQSDEDACRKTSSSEAAYAECLRARGWSVSVPGERTAPAADTEPSATAPHVPAPAAPGTPAAAHHEKPASAAAGTTAPRPAAAASSAAASTPPAPPKPSPTTLVTVSSWWKLGGNGGDLDAAVAACVDQLGPTHRPAHGPTEVTVALRDCLRGKSWFPMGGSGAK